MSQINQEVIEEEEGTERENSANISASIEEDDRVQVFNQAKQQLKMMLSEQTNTFESLKKASDRPESGQNEGGSMSRASKAKQNTG